MLYNFKLASGEKKELVVSEIDNQQRNILGKTKNYSKYWKNAALSLIVFISTVIITAMWFTRPPELLKHGMIRRNVPELKTCIIGAGKSGLTSTKLFLQNMNNYEPIVFERSTDIGGQWKYSSRTDADVHGLPVGSGVYQNLRTNDPKLLMSLPDYEIEFGGENRSYVKHEFVFEYLTNYTEDFNLRQYIKFDTLVEKVSPLQNNRWRVETRNLNNNKWTAYTCDVVLVCNGHFIKTNWPNIPGLETFPGRKLHSHSYRKPEEFTGKTVALLGASYSGLDIGIELSNYAEKIYLSHLGNKITMELPKKMIQVPTVVAVNGSDLILNNGSRIQADAFILCTGYFYDFPFLDESSGITVTDGKYVHPLYKSFININHPTMAFIDLPVSGINYLVPYHQLHYFISVLQGKSKLPSRATMMKDSQLPPGTPIEKAHYKEDTIIEYLEDLAKSAGITPLDGEMKKAIKLYFDDKNSDVMHFKDHELIIDSDGHAKPIKP